MNCLQRIAVFILSLPLAFSASGLTLDPDLTATDFAKPVFIPFVYNFRSNAFHWTVGDGARTPDGAPHPWAATVRGGVHADMFTALGVTDRTDWGGGGFLYDPQTKKLMFPPVAGIWSLGTNDYQWNNKGGLLPWQYIDTAIEAAIDRMGLRFQPFLEPGRTAESVLNTLREHHAFPQDIDEPGQRAMAEYLDLVARDPEGILREKAEVHAGLRQTTSCGHLLGVLTDHHPTRTPAILGRGRLGSMILD